jgi:hypothetical protein
MAVTTAAGAAAPTAASGGNAALLGAMTMPTRAEVVSVWAARPDYVQALPKDAQAAYAFALARPDLLQWMPCYCGCAKSGHRSNLDCFFQSREAKGNYTYEQHASFCGVCVTTANLAAQLMAQGQSPTQIRAAVDAQFGAGAAPGTDTPQPPV